MPPKDGGTPAAPRFQMRRTLFIKIFLWFWLANIIVIGALALVIWLTPRETLPRRLPVHRLHALQVRGAAAVLRSQGRQAWEAQLTDLHEASALMTYWIDAGGREMRGERMSEAAAEFMRLREGETRDGHMAYDREPPNLMVIPVTDADGGLIRVVLESQWEQRGFGSPLGKTNWPALAVAAVVAAGLGCYALARYLTEPLNKLGAAARRIASGDLNVRVGQPLARRGDEIGELGRDFDRMTGRLRALVESQRRLLQDVSHELRSPLARLNVALEIAERDSGSPAAPALQRGQREVERLNELIGQLLKLSRLEVETSPPLRETVELHEVVQRVADDAEFEAGATSRSVALRRCEPCRVEGSTELLSSAIENVVRNAVRYSPVGGTTEVSLRIDARSEEKLAIIEVHDQGPGVPTEELTRIFKPFHRVNAESDASGAGLGLAIARRAVELHGGTVRAENKLSGGLVVIMEIPGVTAG